MATNNVVNAPFPLSPTQGGLGVASPIIHTLPVAQGSANFNFLGPLTNGQLLIGSTGADPVAAAISAGTNVTVTNGAGTITIAATGVAGFVWNDVSGTTQAAAVNNGYIISNAAQTNVTLPATAAEGSIVSIAGKGAAGWIMTANTGQVIHFGNSATSTAGSLTSTNQWDGVSVVCVTANTTWAVTMAVGNLTVA